MEDAPWQPHHSHLLSDGSTFPPVTPDPPPPPGYVDPLAASERTAGSAEGTEGESSIGD